LDVLAGTGALSRLPEELRTVDPDLADTVQRFVREEDSAAAKHSDAAVSNRKLLEIWNDLWGRWNSHVCEVGDEEGEYVFKDNDWEPPYFDPTALAEDLEQIVMAPDSSSIRAASRKSLCMAAVSPCVIRLIVPFSFMWL
jgi:hypothetical protein